MYNKQERLDFLSQHTPHIANTTLPIYGVVKSVPEHHLFLLKAVPPRSFP